MNKRIENLLALMKNRDAEYFLITSSQNLYYYSGFTGGEAFVLINGSKQYIFTDFRYKEQVAKETIGFEIVIINRSLETDFIDFVNDFCIKDVFFEPCLSVERYFKIKEGLVEKNFDPLPKIADIPRQIKTSEEIELIKTACKIADDSFLKLLDFVRPGITESELSLELEYLMKKAGAQEVSFSTTIASGWRSALPHGTASEKVINNNEIITFDFGAKYKEYCSDTTRTIFIGSCTTRQKKIYNIVREAQEIALSNIYDGANNFIVDKCARDIIDNMGFKDSFGHGLGHGVGLMIHEDPRLSPLVDKNNTLKSGMVVTVEPGIYLEGEFGVRIEDTIMVKNNGIDVFTKLEKNIIIL